MANLSVENLNNIMQTGDVDKLFGATGGGSSITNEAQAMRQMQAEGLVPSANTPTTFSEILRNSVEQVNEYQHQADQAIGELIAGRTKNIHETMLAVERADDSLRLMMQVRNKILDAYREIMRMQV